MDVISRGPLRSAGLVWQQKLGSYMMTVTCKVTFQLVPGECSLVPEPGDLNEVDQYLDDNPARSLVAPRDLIPSKRNIEVVLVGSAYSPRKDPVQSLVVRMCVGNVDKSLAIHAERHLTSAGLVRDTIPFVRMPLRYERAAWSPDNPVGIRVEPRADNKPVPLPNILPVGFRVTGFAEKIPAVGFGPLAPTWPARANLLAKTSPAWTAERWKNVPMPERFDLGFFDIAPPDQRLSRLLPDEFIVLENLHPQHPSLVTRLPGITPKAIVERSGQAPAPVELIPDTLWIDCDESICSVTYRGWLLLDSPTQPGRVLINMVRQSSRAAAAVAPAAPAPDRPSAPVGRKQTLVMAPPAKIEMEFEEDESDHTQRMATAAVQSAVPHQTATPAPAPETELPKPVPGPAAPIAPKTLDLGVSFAPQPATPFAAVLPSEPAKIIVKARASGAVVKEDPPRPASLDQLTHLRNLASSPAGSAAALSDAAAGISPSKEPPKETPTPEARPVPSTIVDLLWFDPASVERIRTEPAWKNILDKAPPAGNKSKEPEERRHIRTLLAAATPSNAEELRLAMINAVDEMGAFTPPLVLLGGEMVFPFDEVETLKATLGAVMPFLASDKKLKELVEATTELLKMPWIAGGAAEAMATPIRAAFAEKNRGLPANYLDTQTERVLLEKRHYQKRTVFKQQYLRASLHLPGSAEPLTAYLPANLAQELPAFQRLRVRVIAESHAQVDQYEASSWALKCVAVGRELSGWGRK